MLTVYIFSNDTGIDFGLTRYEILIFKQGELVNCDETNLLHRQEMKWLMRIGIDTAKHLKLIKSRREKKEYERRLKSGVKINKKKWDT